MIQEKGEAISKQTNGYKFIICQNKVVHVPCSIKTEFNEEYCTVVMRSLSDF